MSFMNGPANSTNIKKSFWAVKMKAFPGGRRGGIPARRPRRGSRCPSCPVDVESEILRLRHSTNACKFGIIHLLSLFHIAKRKILPIAVWNASRCMVFFMRYASSISSDVCGVLGTIGGVGSPPSVEGVLGEDDDLKTEQVQPTCEH